MQEGKSSTDVNGRVYEGFKRPIGEWNCKHFALPIIIGVSEPTYTEEELEKMRQNSRQKYDATQEMRRRETELRKLKDRRMALSAAGDTLDAQRCQREINIKQKEYNSFCAKNGLSPHPERAQIEGYRRIATKELKDLENNGMINTYKGKGVEIIGDSEISQQTVRLVEEATKRVTSDFKILEKYSEPISFGYLDSGLAMNKYNPNTGHNTIVLSKSDFANPDNLLKKLKEDYKSGLSYETSTIQSLIAHEMGHNAHIALALKPAGLSYGEPLSPKQLVLFNR
jgi:hypothetical protein